MAEPRYRIVATAGHVDHGKSTLIEALTGIDPDRLPEEKRRQMTIDLGFAALKLTLPTGEPLGVGLVDVPGHADFVRNMVAGVGSIDAAILVVAADDGWMPQTEEHLRILLYLGVRSAVIALTKSDTTADPGAVAAEIAGRVRGTAFEGAPVVPVCALGGQGLDAFTAALARVLGETPEPADTGHPRLFVDRAFSPRGTGTIVTGTLAGGCFQVGDEIVVLPCGAAARVRGLQNHGQAVDRVRPGMRVAMNLPGVALADSPSSAAGVARGSVVVLPELASGLSRCLHVWLTRLPESAAAGSPPPHRLRHGQRVWVHHGTGVVSGRIALPDGGELLPGDATAAELRLEGALAALDGDRLVLRDFSKRHTLAGGTIVRTANIRPGSLRFPGEADSIRRCALAPDDPREWLRATLRRDGFLVRERPLPCSGFSRDALGAALASLDDTEPVGPYLVGRAGWRRSLDAAKEAVAAWHRNRPGDAAGIPLPELRVALRQTLASPRLFEPLIEALAKQEFVRSNGGLRARGFVPLLPPAVRTARLRLLAALNATPENPPGISSLTNSPDDTAALNSLVRSGRFFMLTPEIAFATSAYEALREKARAYLLQHETATIAELRDALGTARRILVPVCEKMDKDRVTVRQGDRRRLARPPS